MTTLSEAEFVSNKEQHICVTATIVIFVVKCERYFCSQIKWPPSISVLTSNIIIPQVEVDDVNINDSFVDRTSFINEFNAHEVGYNFK